MLQRHHHILRRLHNLIDAFLTAVTFGGVYLFRDYFVAWFSTEDLGPLLPFERYAPLMLLAVVLWPVVLNYHGLYDLTRLRKAFTNIGIIFRGSLESTLLLVAIIFLFQMESISRFFLVGFGFANASVLVVKDLIRRQSALRRRLQGMDIRPVLVVGTFASAAPFIRKMKEESHLGLRPVGVVFPKQGEGPTHIHGIPVVGTLSLWREILHRHPVAYVIFTIHHEFLQEVEEALRVCQEEGVQVWVVANFFTWNLSQVGVDHFGNIPILVFHTCPILSWPYIFKLLLDRLFAFFFLLFLSPLFLFIACGIWLTSGRPILYRQSRVGRFGQCFQLYKFRTFENGGANPTRFGSGLRQMGLDEIPQLINILKGEMSFIGPRPHIPEEVERYQEPWQRRRFSMLPGLSCYRQILRPGKVSFDEAIALDLKYIDQWSLWVDLYLVYRTVVLMVQRVGRRGRGASCT